MSCASYSSHIDPRPTPKGEIRVGGNLDILVTDRPRGGSILPNFEATVRYGLSDRVDIGGKVNLFGAEMSAKLNVVNDSVSVSVVPGAGAGIGSLAGDDSQAFIATFFVAALVGFDVGERSRIIVGLKPLVQTAAGTGLEGEPLRYGDLMIAPGALVGFRMPLGDTLVVFPEVAVHLPYAVEATRWLDPVWQGGLALQFAANR